MDNIDIKKAAIHKALVLNRTVFARKAWLFRDLCLFFAALFVSLFLLEGYIELERADLSFGTGVIFFSLFLFFSQVDIFFNYCLKKPRLLLDMREVSKDASQVNIGEYLDFESAFVVEKAEKNKGTDSYLLLFYLLKYAGGDMNFIFHRALIDKEEVLRDLKNVFEEKKNLSEEGHADCFVNTLREAFDIAIKRGGKRISKEDLFVALTKNNRYLQELLYRKGLKEEDVLELTSWKRRVYKKEDPFDYGNLIKRGRIGTEWASGYTPFLDKFSVDWTRTLRGSGFPETVGHKEEGVSLERVLARNETNSAILVGEPGTGRKSIVREVIRKSFLGESLPEINHCRFLELDMFSLLAQVSGIEEAERVLDELFGEAIRAGNVVLVINDLHNYIGQEQKPGVLDISGVLASYLHLPNFRLIGITSFSGYRKNIELNASVDSLLEKIEVSAATDKDALILMEKEALYWERKYRKLIPFVSLKKIISLTKRYMETEPFPEKALDLLEEVVVHVDQKGEDVLLPEHVEKVVSERTEVPVGEASKEEKDILLNLEKHLREKMVNQEEAVRAVSLALRRSRADIDTRKGLIGGFLFLGPTGVGKTYLGKVLSEVYFGRAKKTIRIDMSEFQNISDIYRLIGSSKEEGILTSKVREDPFSLVLLDEIEKAHPDILNLFLQVLDEGHITDGKGRKVSFKNTIIIATSNAGYQVILDAFEKNAEDWEEVKDKIMKHLFRNSTFRPEFVNRFDDVVLFKPLRKEDLLSIAEMQLGEMAGKFEDKDINFIITDELKEKIVDLSYDPVFGAREMQRSIQNNIGDVLASAILKGELERGESFTINPENFSIEKQE